MALPFLFLLYLLEVLFSSLPSLPTLVSLSSRVFSSSLSPPISNILS